jgi:hypothetical protein
MAAARCRLFFLIPQSLTEGLRERFRRHGTGVRKCGRNGAWPAPIRRPIKRRLRLRNRLQNGRAKALIGRLPNTRFISDHF